MLLLLNLNMQMPVGHYIKYSEWCHWLLGMQNLKKPAKAHKEKQRGVIKRRLVHELKCQTQELEHYQFKPHYALDQVLLPNLVTKILLITRSNLNDAKNKQWVSEAGPLTVSQSSPKTNAHQKKLCSFWTWNLLHRETFNALCSLKGHTRTWLFNRHQV